MSALKPRPPFQVLVMSEESRLGREAIETAYALKQIITVGVRVFFYLEDRERTLESPTDKLLLSVTAFADELEREKARQRTYDAMQRKARAGQVTGGRVFGYDNVDVFSDRVDASGRPRRAHVERRINEREAAVVRRIFDLCAAGHGMKQISYQLNADGASAPRPQRGRPAGWAPSSIREILHRPLYRGEIVWNRSRKRNTWGQKQQRPRPETEWLRIPAPQLQIVSDELWRAAHGRLEEARAVYLRGTNGQLWGQPARGVESKYLLVGLASCGVCGAGVSVRSCLRSRHRYFYYVCTASYTRGPHVFGNGAHWAMDGLDRTVLDAIASQVLSPVALSRALTRALDLVVTAPTSSTGARAGLERDLRDVDARIEPLVGAIADGDPMPELLARLKQERGRTAALVAQLEALPRIDRGQLQARAREKLADWRGLLERQASYGRQVLRKILIGRLTVTPEADGAHLTGTATWGKLFSGLLLPKGMASPTGFEPVF